MSGYCMQMLTPRQHLNNANESPTMNFSHAPAFYSFTPAVPTWINSTTLGRPVLTAEEQSGWSVALDDTHAIVGSHFNTAHIFNVQTKAHIHTLTNPTGIAGDYFGTSVGISGNYAIVGAYYTSVPGVASTGQAYIYDVTTGALVHTLANPAASIIDYYGVSVAISGNYAVVGASYKAVGGSSDAGQAYVYNVTTGALVHTLVSPIAGNSLFGGSVSIVGDLIAIAAGLQDISGVRAIGAVYLFSASSGSLVSTISNPAPVQDDGFGVVSINGTYAIVGVTTKDIGATNAGRAYVFDTATGALLSTLINPSPSTNDQFGNTVSVNDKYAVVGCVGESSGSSLYIGKAYVFDIKTGTLLSTLTNLGGVAQDYFAMSVAINANNTILVGTPYKEVSGVTNAGATYVFQTA